MEIVENLAVIFCNITVGRQAPAACTKIVNMLIFKMDDAVYFLDYNKLSSCNLQIFALPICWPPDCLG